MPRRITPVVLNIVIINFLVFLFINIYSENFTGPNAEWGKYFMLFKTGLIWDTPYTDYFKPVQLVATMFTHFDFLHIFFNMFTLVSLGTMVESVMGRRDFLILYLFSGLFGSILVALFDPSPSPVIGASGALFGVFGAFAFYFPNLKLSLFFIPIGIKAKNLVIGIAALSVAVTVYNLIIENSPGFWTSQSDPRILGGISHFGHLAGLASGLLFLYRKKILGIFKR